MHIANTWRINAMNFYKTLDLIMRQDIGGRGLLPSLPASPLAETAAALSGAKRAVLLTARCISQSVSVLRRLYLRPQPQGQVFAGTKDSAGA